MINQTLVIGICGLIGSGKSTFIKRLCEDRYAHFDCDSAAKEVYKTPTVRESVTHILGYDPIDVHGQLRKKEIADSITHDANKRQDLEHLIHDAVDRRFIKSCQGHEVMIIESAILFTSGLTRFCDLTVAIDTDRDIRRQRVRDRDGQEDRTRFDRIDQLQRTESRRLQEADIIIYNLNETTIEQEVQHLRLIIEKTRNAQG